MPSVGFLLFLLLSQGRTMTDAEIKQYLPRLIEPGQTEANVSAADGQYLHDLVVRTKAKRVLEIGTARGYSAIWLAMGLRKTGGQLITLEIHETHQAMAREHLEITGLNTIVEARLADALEAVPGIEGPFDLVFIDAIKSDYPRYLELVLPKVRKGGAIVAHNVVSNATEMPDFLKRIKTDPGLRTEFFGGSSRGLSVSYKK